MGTAAHGRGVAGRLECAAAVLAAVVALVVLGFRLARGEPPATAVGAALAVLLVGVPCALRLATGLPRLVGTERAARRGVLVSGAGAFAAARHVDTVVLAGSGTLTGGGLAVHAVHAVDGAAPAEVLRLAGAVAVESGHPVDRAVAAAAHEPPDVAEFDTVDGLGVRGLVAEVVGAPGEDQRVIAHAVLVGDAGLLTAHDIEPPARSPEVGCVPVAVAWDGVARGMLEVGPAVDPATAAAVRRLATLGARPVLAAAEPGPVARAVGARAGLAPDAVLAGVAAEDAASAVRGLGPHVAVIGDSARYAEALDVADLAVRLPPHTGDASHEDRPALTALRDDLPGAVDALRLTRHTAAVARANLAVSLACVTVLLPVTATGLVGPVVSAAATAAGGAVIAANSLRASATDG